ncbi:hypothetical protein [Candidatus Nitrosocosmicus sp. T]
MSTISSIKFLRDILYEYQNFIIVIGLIISFSGGSWDITFHILSQPESFFSYPHTLVYTGILIVISIFFINFRINILNKNPTRKDNCVILLGAGLILAAGPFDFSWHLKFGLDGLLSPPHITLLTGWLIVGLGNLRITNKLIDLTIGRERAKRGKSVGIIEPTYHHRRGAGNARNDYEKLDIMANQATNLGNKGLTLIRFQLFLNLSFILMILSGFIYFFSLPFSETQYYNYNPDPLIAFFVYSLGFPILLSCFFIRVLKNYRGFEEMVLLVGSFYIVIMLLTQILSNPFLVYYSWYYILNIIPFAVIYLINKMQIKNKRFTKRNALIESHSSGAEAAAAGAGGGDVKEHTNKKLYIFYALILSISSVTICFPLNTYILNEQLYGYLVYQNLVFKVFVQIFVDYFMIIILLSVIGGLLGLWLEWVISSMYKGAYYRFHQYFTNHK